MEPVVILRTGVANTASVAAAIRRCGCEVEFTDDADRARSAERLVLPGVGSFAGGMKFLRDRGLDEVVCDRVVEQRPLLAICLGLQLLCTRSEESMGVDGLGVVDAVVRRLPDGVAVPQFGWNRVDASPGCGVTDGYAYYANSYCVSDHVNEWSVATTLYGERFVAAMKQGPVLACQFHPELSGAWGTELIRRWILCGRVGARC